MSVEAVASWILKFAQHCPSQAKNAYAGFLLIPGWESLRFTAGIRQAKRFWDTSGEKYGDFWDADLILEKLSVEPLDWSSVVAVRDRAIVVLRLFHLCRSVDLSRALRCRSQVGQTVHWRLQRKGQRSAKWEALIRIDNPKLSPLHLLQRYVELTVNHGKRGGQFS